MQRVLEPGQIESFAQRAISRLRLPDREHVFSRRADRMRALAGDDAIGRPIGNYLLLMARIAHEQQALLNDLQLQASDAVQITQAPHGMPPVYTAAWPRETHWRDVLMKLCSSVIRLSDVPAAAHAVCERLILLAPEQIERQADALLCGNPAPVDAACAPLLMAALQVYWVDLASRRVAEPVAALGASSVCPLCGTPPVASIVRTEPGSQGYRYLHCALCATEWHMVRITCSHCQSTKGIEYRSIEGGSQAIRAECCNACGVYRKILYQENDAAVEAIADDLASLTLDLLVSEAGFQRASGNPLLWRSAVA